MKYRERQEDTDWLDQDMREGLLLTFRGVGKKAVEASRRHSVAHWRIQKPLSDSVVYSALAGDKVWTTVTEVIDHLAEEARLRPRQFCEPPEIPDDWEAFRKVLLGYAPNPWWYSTLGLEDLCKPSSWQSWLSRRTVPRVFDDLLARARAWRADVMQGLDRWEVGVEEQFYWMEMLHFRVKDALDQSGEIAAWEAFKHLRRYGRRVDTRRYPSIYRSHFFDPANPNGPQFEFDWDGDDRAEFVALLNSGFPGYRSAEAQPTCVETVTRMIEFASEDYRQEWESEVEIERTGTWNPIVRTMEWDEKIKRVRVKVPARYANEGEQVSATSKRFHPKNERGKEIVDVWEHEVTEFVYRWRPYHPDHDVLGGADGREKVQLIVGDNLQNGTDDDAECYLKQVIAPVEETWRGE